MYNCICIEIYDNSCTALIVWLQFPCWLSKHVQNYYQQHVWIVYTLFWVLIEIYDAVENVCPHKVTISTHTIICYTYINMYQIQWDMMKIKFTLIIPMSYSETTLMNMNIFGKMLFSQNIPKWNVSIQFRPIIFMAFCLHTMPLISITPQ